MRNQRAVRNIQQEQILRPDDIEWVREQMSPGQLIVVQQSPKPWGWIVTGAIGTLFCVFSFLHWLVMTLLKHADKQTDRAHELSMKALETAQKVQPKKASVDIESLTGDPGFVFVAFCVVLALCFILKGIFK
ncbi:MAG: hypothetical protein ACR2QF_00900 [Geminicoccaceae bacterium]